MFIQILHYIVNGDENLILFLFYSSRVKLRGKIYWYLQMICINSTRRVLYKETIYKDSIRHHLLFYFLEKRPDSIVVYRLTDWSCLSVELFLLQQ